MNAPKLNADLGEGEAPGHTIGLIQCIDAANIACGVHAGDGKSIVFCIEQALLHQVKIGAHPGLPGSKGRGTCSLSSSELRRLLDDQVLPFVRRVDAAGATMHHIKLHGALYHATDRDPTLAQCYLDWCREHIPTARIIARSGGVTADLATQQHIHCWHECFLDRSYESDGTLRDRSHVDALIHDIHALQDRLREWSHHGILRACDGTILSLPCDTFCLHSDSPASLMFALAARQHFGPRIS
jgi:UPF0271 protein